MARHGTVGAKDPSGTATRNPATKKTRRNKWEMLSKRCRMLRGPFGPMATEKGHKVRHPIAVRRPRRARGNLSPRTAAMGHLPTTELAKKMLAAANATVEAAATEPMAPWVPTASVYRGFVVSSAGRDAPRVCSNGAARHKVCARERSRMAIVAASSGAGARVSYSQFQRGGLGREVEERGRP